MGRKPTGKGKRLSFYLAGFLILQGFLSGCIAGMPLRVELRSPLETARAQFSQNHFDTALKGSEAVLRDAPEEYGDQALYLMGLIYAHPGNPDKDEQKALEHFNRVLEGYPESPLAPEALAWSLNLKGWILTKEELFLAETRLLALDADKASLEQNLREKGSQIEMLEDHVHSLEQLVEGFKEADARTEWKRRNIFLWLGR